MGINKIVLMAAILAMLCVLLAASALAADKAWIEMPSEATDSQEFKVILHIDDPDLQKYTKRIFGLFETYGGHLYYLKDGDKPGAYSEFDYNGESTITYTMLGQVQPEDYERPSEYTITFRFIVDPEELSAKYKQLEGGYYYDGNIGHVTKNITINPVRFDMEIPSAPGKLMADKSTWDYVDFYSGFGFMYTAEDDYYSDSKSFYGSIGRTICMDPSVFGGDSGYCNNPYIEPYGNMVVDEGSVSVAGLPGKYYLSTTTSNFKKDDYDEDTGERGDMEDVFLSFRAAAKKGWLEYTANVYKAGRILASEKDSYVRDSLSEMKTVAQSASFTQLRSSGKSQKSVYVSYLDEEEEPTLKVWGTISNLDANPMPYAELAATIKGKNFFGNTTKEGDFNIPLAGLVLGKDETEVNGTLFITLNYNREGKNYYDVRYLVSQNPNRYEKVWFSIPFTLKDKQDAEVHWEVGKAGNAAEKSNLQWWTDRRDNSVIYYHMHEAVEFALTKLKANIDHKLPVEVWVGNGDGDTLYNGQFSHILIAMSDKSYLSMNKPKNREYHEFAHHIMFAEYKDWPDGRALPGTVNHDGFLNPSTADSYLEGFAEFMAMVIAKDVGDKKPNEYANLGNLENNYWPQHGGGGLEEFAIAGILWDMYDKENDKGDTLTLPLDEMWGVLKVKRADFYEYYKAFKAKWPSKADAIDKLFIAHGLFTDSTVGNKKHDGFEAFRNTNNDPNWNPGEFFVDFGVQAKIEELKYEQGDVIGKAANYERAANRSSAVVVPNAFIKVEDTEIRYYKIKVDFATSEDGTDYEYISDVRDGLLYVAPLPDNIDALITITPYSQDYKTSKPYTLATRDMRKQLYSNQSSQGYFASYDFNLQPTGKKLDPVVEYRPEEEPTYAYKGDIDSESTSLKLGGGKRGGAGGAWLWILIVLVLVCGAGAFFFLKKGKKMHGHNQASHHKKGD